MRLPNGYGSVVKLTGKRRRPYMVRKTVGFKENGQPIYNIIGYTPTREDGLELLSQYNHDPWDVNVHDITFNDLYKMMVDKCSVRWSPAKLKSIKTAYIKCTNIYNCPYRMIRAIEFQEIIDQYQKSPATQKRIRSLIVNMDRFALEAGVPTHQYSSILHVGPTPESRKKPFEVDQIHRVWELYESGNSFAGVILIFIYSGFRIQELLTMKVTDVDLNQMIMRGGEKTEAGRGRIVPIHPYIADIVKSLCTERSEYLIHQPNGKKWYETQFYKKWYETLDLINIKKAPHEARHTFRTLLDYANANKKCIDMMMGHKTSDVGLRVYTHKTVDDLKEAISLITVR